MVLNHILEVSKSGKAPKTKIGSDLATFASTYIACRAEATEIQSPLLLLAGRPLPLLVAMLFYNA